MLMHAGAPWLLQADVECATPADWSADAIETSPTLGFINHNIVFS